jgi:orotidine-5'-phosphate decarboxylase
MTARDRLFVALDVPDATPARAMVARLGDSISHYKIGLELLFGGGLDLASELKAQGKHVFLDMKLLDIGNTVEKATANIAARGLDFLTVHGTDRKTLDAAVKGRGAGKLKLLAVTVLTNIDADDLAQQGIADGARDIVLRRARMAAEAGFDGCIASGEEAAALRSVVPKGFLIVTPGIRPAGSAAGDQARVTTPARAIGNGASHLVVGRPITGAADPKAAAGAIISEIVAATAGRLAQG